MDEEKKSARHLMGKRVVTKTGKIFGDVSNVVFEVKTGELLQLVLKNTTGYCEGLDLERTKNNEALIPFSAVVALGDFVVVAEEDII
ncbi:MAG TPA: PRC-barrel domain-containing protein [Candidatus Nanoarchaeia archaeon]|nr:PRC-barrel domain-containing protein [Candidatus Nanoarchaeia archaeon]